MRVDRRPARPRRSGRGHDPDLLRAGEALARPGRPSARSSPPRAGRASPRPRRRPFYADLFAPLLDRRDLLTIDLRGTGRSGAIDCPDLQHGVGDQVDRAARVRAAARRARRRCTARGDRAEDIEAVRAALGIPRFDYYGISGGGLQVQAYAARYGKRLRTAVMDAPYRVGFDDAFQSPVATALVRSAVLVCKRSPSCDAADPHPRRTLRALLERVRRAPVAGTRARRRRAAARRRRRRGARGRPARRHERRLPRRLRDQRRRARARARRPRAAAAHGGGDRRTRGSSTRATRASTPTATSRRRSAPTASSRSRSPRGEAARRAQYDAAVARAAAERVRAVRGARVARLARGARGRLRGVARRAPRAPGDPAAARRSPPCRRWR